MQYAVHKTKKVDYQRTTSIKCCCNKYKKISKKSQMTIFSFMLMSSDFWMFLVSKHCSPTKTTFLTCNRLQIFYNSWDYNDRYCRNDHSVELRSSVLQIISMIVFYSLSVFKVFPIWQFIPFWPSFRFDSYDVFWQIRTTLRVSVELTVLGRFKAFVQFDGHSCLRNVVVLAVLAFLHFLLFSQFSSVLTTSGLGCLDSCVNFLLFLKL